MAYYPTINDKALRIEATSPAGKDWRFFLPDGTELKGVLAADIIARPGKLARVRIEMFARGAMMADVMKGRPRKRLMTKS